MSHQVVFPLPYSNATPVEVYADVQCLNSRLNRQILFSLPITSAGARRLLKEPSPERAQIVEVARLNLEIASSLLDACAGDLNDDTLVASSAPFGLWEGWGESDYIRYWLYHISGIPVAEAFAFEALYQKRIGSAHSPMNDYTKSHAEREGFYSNLLSLYCSFLENVADLRPVMRLICLPDAQASLGCRTEIRLARFLGIPIERLLIDRTHSSFSQISCLATMHEVAEADPEYELPFFSGDGSRLAHFVSLELDHVLV